MSDLKLFRIEAGLAHPLTGGAVSLERTLQTVIERNMAALFGVHSLASEYSTGTKHGGRIDSLGLDENGSPVIFEYKRAINENVINQGLFYLDWLMDHRGDFTLLVQKSLGTSSEVDWTAPRLVCGRSSGVPRCTGPRRGRCCAGAATSCGHRTGHGTCARGLGRSSR